MHSLFSINAETSGTFHFFFFNAASHFFYASERFLARKTLFISGGEVRV